MRKEENHFFIKVSFFMLYTGHKIKSGWLAFVASMTRMARACGSHDLHGSRLWLAMTRMARVCGSHGSRLWLA
jgi:hypothetical protein